MSGYDDKKDFVVAEARRKWSAAERMAIAAETQGASVSSVARKHGVATSLLFRWRRDAGMGTKRAKCRDPGAVTFLPVVTQGATAAQLQSGAQHQDAASLIEIELANGHKLRVNGGIDGAALKHVLAALTDRTLTDKTA